MTDATARPASATRNLSALLVGAIVCEFLWSWFNFSGPYRKLIDLQLDWSGGWSEWPAALVLGLAAVAASAFAVVVLERLLPDPPAIAVDMLVVAILLAASCGMLLKARHLWDEASRVPGVQGPVQVVDLATLGGGAPPTGHVRLLGAPAQARAVTLRFHNRAASRLDTYVPMAIDAGAGTLRILVTTGGHDDSVLGRIIPADPEGVLLFDAIDTRTIYQLRQRGLPVADHPFVLFWPKADVDDDLQIEAVLLALPALLFWPFVMVDWWRRRRSAGAPSPAESPEPAPAPAPAPMAAPAESPLYVGYAEPPQDWNWRRDTSLAGLGFGVSVFALMALWEWGDVLPGSLEISGYKTAGVLLFVSLVVNLLPSRQAKQAVATPARTGARAEVPPPPDAAWLVLMRDAAISDKVYLRADVDGVRAAILKSRRYAVVALRAGPHTLAVNARWSIVRDSVMNFELAAQEILVLRVSPPFLSRPFAERVPDLVDAYVRMAGLQSATPSVPLPLRR